MNNYTTMNLKKTFKSLVFQSALLISFTFSSIGFAQWQPSGQTSGSIYYTGGKVGIGTTSPGGMLQIVGQNEEPQLLLSNFSVNSTNTTGTASLRFGFANHLGPKIEAFKHVTNHTGLKFYIEQGYNNLNLGMTIRGYSDGPHVGIGTDNPQAKMQIVSQSEAPQLLLSNFGVNTTNTSGTASLRFGFADHLGPKIEAFKHTANHTGLKFYVEQGYNNLNLGMTVRGYADGPRVGIGTMNPDSRLTVNGHIHATEVRVDLNIPAPDYVFADDYKLLSLKETEEYINANHHLPEVPSAKVMEKEGVNVSEMNMLLLKKVEELTLHMIEMQKEIERLKAQSNK